MENSFATRVKRVKPKDIGSLFSMLAAFIPSRFVKARRRDLWLICEDEMEARDNGYWLFKYVREYHSDQDCVYAISSQSPDYHKVECLGETVEYGSLKHWIYYLAANRNISSQKAGKPNAAICYALEVYGPLHDRSIYLQHGVILNDLEWLYYEVTRMRIFVCGAFPEYEYVRDHFHYPEGHVKYLGLCRFDNLHDAKCDPKQILIMPTWREWIADDDGRIVEYEGTTDVCKTNYMQTWLSFINSPRLGELVEKHGVRFVFYPHRNMQKFLGMFGVQSEYITIADREHWDVQDLLKTSSMLITDYSSVFFDMVYMKKPVLFYTFDYERFEEGQYGKGYLTYSDNPFGAASDSEEGIFSLLEEILERGCAVSADYLEAHKAFFPLYDSGNCERHYRMLKEL